MVLLCTKASLLKCGPSAPLVRQANCCWAVLVGDRRQRRVASTASGLRVCGRRQT